MKLITSLLLALLSGLVLSQLAACGQKGPLFLPGKPTPISTPAAPTAPASTPTSAPASASPAANPAAKAS